MNENDLSQFQDQTIPKIYLHIMLDLNLVFMLDQFIFLIISKLFRVVPQAPHCVQVQELVLKNHSGVMEFNIALMMRKTVKLQMMVIHFN